MDVHEKRFGRYAPFAAIRFSRSVRVAWDRLLTSQAMAQRNPTSSRATAVVT